MWHMNSTNRQNANLLNCLERISAAASECSLNFNKLTQVEDDVKKVSDFLNITKDQTIFFSCLAELSLQKTVSLTALSKHLKCTILKSITLMYEIEALEEKGLIQKSFKKGGQNISYNDMGFSVPHNVIEAIRKTDKSLLLKPVKFDLPGFLKHISDIIDERHDNILTTEQVYSETEFLISNNINLPFVAYIDNTLKQTISKCTVFAISYCRLKGQTSVNIDGFADAVFDDLNGMLMFAQQLSSGNHELVKKNILKLSSSEFEGEKLASLTQTINKMLYASFPDLILTDSEKAGLISYKSIKAKELFFNEGTNEQIKTLERVLSRSKFRLYNKELQQNRLSGGITSIFSGDPGTGKTEAVYQLALKTKRDIMMVDLSQTKSKWFGESEKIVKKIFDDYSVMVNNCQTEPILLINEADGLFSKRLDLWNRGTSTDQTMNTIQNILLQELENFKGILIATTNLTGNLDRAFERRFTFKIEFSRPTPDTGIKIWKSKLPELTLSEAAELSRRFDFTGGEIDVQIRQIILKKILNKNFNLFDAIVVSCSREHGFQTRKRVGF